MSDPQANGSGDGQATTTEPTEFSHEFHEDARRLVLRYPVGRSALLPLLHLVQSEHGHVTHAGIVFCADALDLTKAEVAAVATFYTMFKRSPVGDYLLSVCTNPTCQVAGSQVIFERYKEALGDQVHDPETKVSIEQAECLGICDAAPVVQVNYDMYGPLTDEEADRLLQACRDGSPPASTWSGEPAPTFSEVERELSGANDAFGDDLVSAAHHSIAGYDNPPSYKTGETDIPVTHPDGDRTGHGGAIFAAEFAGIEPPTHDDDRDLSAEQADQVDEVAATADDTAEATGSPEAAEQADAADHAADTDDADTADTDDDAADTDTDDTDADDPADAATGANAADAGTDSAGTDDAAGAADEEEIVEDASGVEAGGDASDRDAGSADGEEA